MKKLALLMLVLIAGTSIAVAVKASQSKRIPYCHCEPDRKCSNTATGTWGIKVDICP
ncbi:hypothetical protein [Chitinophaga tropicalis]|uniref:Uncharacterized protein n=1 Tax=Chitinophaga tropicalis TaxID=2683588 RepID=A0A7K1U0X2_9BACT|nr:hypothetical protein [Chitinophaga tropicalis]MVT08008.1 hypothetical protein [Chitinophaga tropicalis]